MAIKVGINGFGRIGRTVFRILSDRQDIEVVAINDLYDNDQLAYLLKYDTVMGIFDKKIEFDEDTMTVAGRTIAMTAEKDPAAIPWAKYGAEIVIESTGVFRDRAKLEKHLKAGARKVILTVPSKDPIDATIVIGVNEGILRPEHQAGLERLLHHQLPGAAGEGARRGLRHRRRLHHHGARLHQRPEAGRRPARRLPAKPGRRREHHPRPPPAPPRRCGEVLPQLKERLDGMAMRVPVPDGSIVDLVCRLKQKPDAKAINAAIKEAAEGRLKGILEYTEDPVVSSDIIGNPHSSVFDALCTTAIGDGYAKVRRRGTTTSGATPNRVVDLIPLLA